MDALRIVYVSTLRSDVTGDIIEELVREAAAFNKAQGITGMLAFEDRRVCQILEGPEAAVTSLYKAIQRDPRHFGVVELVRTPIDAPSFQAWGMVKRPMIDMVTLAFTL